MLWVLVMLVVSGVVGGQWWSVYAGVIESTVALISAASLHHEVATHRPLGHVVHVVSSSGTSSTAAPEAWVSSSSSSSAPTSSMEVPSSVGPSSHGVLSPVVAVVSTALAWRRPHHARASTGTEGRSMIVRGRGMVEAGTARRVAAVHGHLHVHVHVVHVVHPWTVAQQALVDWWWSNLVLVLGLLQ